MKAVERGRQDWIIVIIVILGFIFVILAGQLALRFASRWQMNASMESSLDPNSAFLTRRPSGFIEPIDASILTQPSWINDFLTPGVSLITRTPFPPQTPTSITTPTTVGSVTSTVIPTSSLTSTVVYIPVTYTSTSRPRTTATVTKIVTPPTISETATATGTPNLIFTPTSTSTPTATITSSATATMSPTVTATPSSTSTATQTLIPYPPEIGTTPDGVVYALPAGGSLILNINLNANGDAGYDLVYYERPAPTGGVNLDWVIVEIGDGTNWYTVFNWGDNIADTNTNMDFNILPNPQVPPETDQRSIPTASLYNSTGIAINVDAIAPPGTYSYVRFTAPLGDSDGQMEIDAVEVLP